MTRTNAVLAGLAGTQLLLAVGAYAWTAVDTPSERRPLLDLKLAAIDRVEIRDDADDSEPDVVLERRGAAWHLASEHDIPADVSAVEEVLDELLDVSVRDPVARTRTSHASLGVADDTFTRKLTLTAGDRSIDVYVGSGRGAHVRLGDDAAVFKARELSPWSMHTRAMDYIDKVYVDVEVPDVDSLQLGEGLGFVRDADGDGWVLDPPIEGREANSTAVQALVARLDTLRIVSLADDPTAPVQGTTISWTVTEEGQSVPGSFVIGPEEGGQRLILAEGKGFAGRIASSAADPWLEASVDGLTVVAARSAEE